jgi:hypothetical protein
MKMAVFIFLLFAVNPTYAVGWQPTNGWREFSLPGVEQAWQKSDGLDLITVVKSHVDEKLSFANQSLQQISLGLTGYRRATLYEFGFTDWALNNLTANAARDDLVLTGSYISPAKKNKYFIERIIFTKNNMTQLSYISDRPLNSVTLKEITQQLAGYPHE